MTNSQHTGMVSVATFCAETGFGETLVYTSVKNGELPAATLGKRVRIPRRVMDRMLKGEPLEVA